MRGIEGRMKGERGGRKDDVQYRFICKPSSGICLLMYDCMMACLPTRAIRAIRAIAFIFPFYHRLHISTFDTSLVTKRPVLTDLHLGPRFSSLQFDVSSLSTPSRSQPVTSLPLNGYDY